MFACRYRPPPTFTITLLHMVRNSLLNGQDERKEERLLDIPNS